MGKMVLIFDVETGGLNPHRNDVLQLSYQVVDIDTQEVQKRVNHYFAWPNDKSRVSRHAIMVNGLTEKFLSTKELSVMSDALKEFMKDMATVKNVVAHNGDFDKAFIDAEIERQGMKTDDGMWKPMIDTMKTTTHICCLPNTHGGYKWPKLIELAEYLDVRTNDIDLHDSACDVELTKRCFLYLHKTGFYRV